MGNNILIVKLSKILVVTLCVILLGIFSLPSSVSASSIIFKTNVVAVKTGNSFSVPVNIDPVSEKNYTVRLTLDFSPELLEVTSFTFAKNWVAMSQTGYDLIDNQTGELIKTAGYPAGFSENVLFGTITFRAKKAGEDTMTVGIKSFILDANSQSTLVSRPRIAVTITDKTQPRISPSPSVVNPPESLPVTEQPFLFDVEVGPAPQAPGNSQYLLIVFAIIIGLAVSIIIYIVWKKTHFKK